MAGGQMLDLLAPVERPDFEDVARLQRLKTGALMSWCVEAGAVMGGAAPELRTSLRGYAQCLGLAFQIADDLLDCEGDEAMAGKRLRKDAAQGKASFVSLLGPERARRQAEMLAEQASAHLHAFGPRARLLHEILHFAVKRER
jgi:farnesyl diphosphate synthase